MPEAGSTNTMVSHIEALPVWNSESAERWGGEGGCGVFADRLLVRP